MANRYLIASGNSENPAIYDGGTLPDPSDVLRLNGFIWTVTANRTIAQLRCDALAPAVASNAARQVLISNGVTLTVSQLVFGTSANSTVGLIGCASAGATATVVSPLYQRMCFRPMGTEVLNAIGNCETTAAASDGGGGIVNGSGTLNLTGSMTNNGGSFLCDANDGTRLNVTGAMYQVSGGGFLQRGAGATVTLNGIAQVATAPIIDSTTTSWPVFTHNGPAIAGNVPAFRMRSPYYGSGPFTNNGEIMALECARVRLLGTDNQWSMIKSDGSAKTLRTAGLLTGYPAEADVEDGVIYGPSNEFEGTLQPVVINTAQLASDLLTEMNTSNLTIAQGLRDGMGASAAAIAAVGSINVIP